MSTTESTPSGAPALLLRAASVSNEAANPVHDRVPSAESPPGASLPHQLAGTRTGWLTQAALLAADLFGIAWAVGLAWSCLQIYSFFALSQGSNGEWAWTMSTQEMRMIACYAASLLATFYFRGLYEPFLVQPAAELRLLSAKTGAVTLFLCALLVALQAPFSGVAMLAMAGLILLVGLPVGRAALRLLCGRTSWWGVRAVIVGNAGDAEKLQRRMYKKSWSGLRPIGYVLNDPPAGLTPSADYLGSIERLPALSQQFGVSLGVLTAEDRDRDELLQLITCGGSGLRRWIVLNPSPKAPSLWAEPCEVAGAQASTFRVDLMSSTALALKRLLDLAIVIALAIPTLLVVGVIALLVRLSSPGPVFYTQPRIGRLGRRFRVWKFRSMVPNADQILRDYLRDNPAAQAEWDAAQKLKYDPRVTWIGKILRKTSLDELPQVWNVFIGEMSLVGPRPIVDEEVEKLGEVYPLYASAPPGITGLWQVSGRNNTTYEERLELTAYYVRNWSLWLDLYILGCTVKTVLLREGAY